MKGKHRIFLPPKVPGEDRILYEGERICMGKYFLKVPAWDPYSLIEVEADDCEGTLKVIAMESLR